MKKENQATAPKVVTVKPARMLLKSVFVCILLMGFYFSIPNHLLYTKKLYICNAIHLKQASRLANNLLRAFFMPSVYDISSVPCGALMRPLPVSRCIATGSGTFFLSPSNLFHRFI